MKLKRTAALAMGAALTVGSLSGCSQATLNYADEYKKVAAWDASEIQMTGKIAVNSANENKELTFTSTEYASGDKAYAKVDFKSDENSGFNIPEIEVYVDNGTSYINKSYYEHMYSDNGLEVPESIKNIKADYIAVESPFTGCVDMASMQSFVNDPEALINLLKTVFGEDKIDLPYVQNGREYTMNLDSDQIVDLGTKAITAAAGNLDNINTEFKLNLKPEDVSLYKSALTSEDFVNSMSKLKDTLKGSTISTKETFTDDSCTCDFKFNFVINEENTEAAPTKVSIELNSKSAKSEAKDIEIPTNVAKLSQEELLAISQSEQKVNTNTSYGKEIINLENTLANK